MNTRRPVRRGAFLGLASAAVVVALMFGLRLTLGLQAIPDVAADALTLILPGAVFGFLVDRLQEFGRPLMLVGLSSGLLLLGALIGAGAARFLGGWPTPARIAAPALVLSMLTVPVAFVGLPLDMAVEPALTTIAYWVLFAILLDWGLSTAAGQRILVGVGSGLSRRALLYGAGALGATWLASYLGARLAHAVRLGGTRPPAGGTPPSAAPPAQPPQPGGSPAPVEDPFAGEKFITPTKDFYLITKNGVNDPDIDASRWRLQVGGERPFALTYDELRAVPAVEGTWTLECISNLVGGGLLSTAVFRGVPLRDLLERAGLPASAREIRFNSADGYTESLPLETAQDERTIVAYLMNGEPLPKGHGFPARLLGSGRYGMKYPKWLTAVLPVAQPYSGFWEQRGWSKDAFVLATSAIYWPNAEVTVPAGRPFPFMNGRAFAGSRGISKVEVSFDGGRAWSDARLRRVLPADNWMPWTYVWTPPAPGTYGLVVRATDGEGAPQDAAERDSFPNGATGYHRVRIKVV